MSLHSGKFALVNGIGTVRNWNISEQQTPARGRASNTGLAPVRKKGVHSWTGSYSAYGATPACLPGTIFGFTGYGAPDDDTHGSAGQRYVGNAIADSVTINWNWGSGEYLNHVVNFSGHLALTKDVATLSDDVSTPDMPPVALTKIQTGTGATPTYTDVPNIVTASLTITAENQSFVNTSTVVAGDLWTGRKGGPIDWTLTMSQQDNQRVGNFCDIGDNLSIKLFVDATLFWLLQWGHVRDFTGIDANRESGAIISRTINIDQTAIDTGSTLGKITLPSGTQYWPFA